MKTIELRSLVKQRLVQNVSCLRQNVNGYLYVTFLGKNNTAQNVYFGKELSGDLREKYGIEDVFVTDEDKVNVLADLVSAVIVQTENAEGEVRYKIGHSTNYQSTAAMAAAFGLELDEGVTNFDLNDFMAGFTAKPEETPQEPPKLRAGKLRKAA